MPVTPGTRLGPYEVVSLLGAGGMGEVYRARDPKLNRDVAIKILPEALALDPVALSRFEREAQAVAALSHPNILAIHDFGRQGDAAYAVMELLEGETLRARLAHGALPARKAVELAVQIAEGLAAAHEKGIVHRDLKPENIFVTHDGRAKVLDFGLAKRAEVAGSASVSRQTTGGHTGLGIVLGTPAYMSPEQVRGDTVDHRSDTFSFGAVLYEMLTGRQAFARETATESMTAILKEDPPEFAPGPSAPSPGLQRIVQHCLEKKPGERFQSARDIAFALQALSGSAVGSGPSVARPRRGSLRRLAVMAAAAVSVAAGTFATLYFRAARELDVEVSRVTRLAFDPPAGDRLSLGDYGQNYGPQFAISPDGAKLVYTVSKGATTELRLRSLDGVESAAIPGTEGAFAPFFSPDGKRVGFGAGPKLKTVALAGGMPTTLCDAPALRGAVWSDDGWIYFVPKTYMPVYRIREAEAGAKPVRVTQIRAAEGEQQHRWPQVVPGGQAILYVVGSGGEWDDATIVAERLDTGRRSVLVKGGSSPRYLPSGHLVYSRAGSIFALKFDARLLEFEGAPVEVARDVFMDAAGAAQMDVSRRGMLLTAPADSAVGDVMLSSVDRTGRGEPLSAPRQSYSRLAISPDGSRLAAVVGNAIAIIDLARVTTMKLALPARAGYPAWSHDGRRLFFGLEKPQHYEVFSKADDDSGAEHLAFASESSEVPIQISADGTWLLTQREAPDGQSELLLRDVTGSASRTDPKILVRSPFLKNVTGAFSTDARFAAYESGESGRPEIYLRPTSGEDRKWQVSTDGGSSPIWSPNGKEIYYVCGMKFMAAPVDVRAGEPKIGTPKLLFENHEIFSFDVTRDGTRFLVAENPNPGRSLHLDVVLGWFSEVRRKAQEARRP